MNATDRSYLKVAERSEQHVRDVMSMRSRVVAICKAKEAETDARAKTLKEGVDDELLCALAGSAGAFQAMALLVEALPLFVGPQGEPTTTSGAA